MPLNLRFTKNIIFKSSLLIIASCFFFFPHASADSSNLKRAIKKAIDLELYKDERWLKLLRYRSGFLSIESDVKSKAFFNAKDGRTNPKNELIATMKAFNEAINHDDTDSHPKCRFIARYHWLKEKVEWEEDVFPKVNCQRFQKWSKKGQIRSISLIFATGYLGNPASFFGHPLLKFNADKSKAGSNDLLANSLNYGALTPNGEDPLTYSLKGLFGGYNAAFTHLQFYYHNHNYSNNELRDMWEYRLNLKQVEVDHIVRHSWEMLGQEMTYFFTHDNCAYRISELLNLVVEKRILPANVPYAIPHSVFDSVSRVEHNGAPLVSSVTYIPSRQSRMTKKYRSLAEENKIVFKNIVADTDHFDSKEYKSLTDTQKILLLDTLFDYTMFRLSKDEESPIIKAKRKRALKERLRLPTSRAREDQGSPAPIHDGQRPVLTRISQGERSQERIFTDFEIRPAYYDLLSPDTGRLPYSSLAIGRVLIRKEDERFIIRELGFFDVSTLNIAETDLPGDGGLAWKFNLGITSQEIQCADCQVFGTRAGLGKAVMLDPRFVVFAFGNGIAQTAKRDFGSLATQLEAGTIITFSEAWRMIMKQSFTQYHNQGSAYLDTFEVSQRFGAARTWDIRLSYKYQKSNLMKLSYSYYW